MNDTSFMYHNVFIAIKCYFNVIILEMFDRNNSGTINIHEFGDLFKYINQWKALFESIDRDRSGYIEFNELTQGEHSPQMSKVSLPRCPLQTSLIRTPLARSTWTSSNSCSTTLISGRQSLSPMTRTDPAGSNRMNWPKVTILTCTHTPLAQDDKST